MQGQDVWDVVNARRPLAQVQQAQGSTQPQAPRPRDDDRRYPKRKPPPRDDYTSPEQPRGPDWIEDDTMRQSTPPGHPYETGDQTRDRYQRQVRKGADADDPDREVYRNSDEFQRRARAAYNAGLNGDNGAWGSFPHTPFGEVQRKAFREGVAERQRRQQRQQQQGQRQVRR